MKWTRGHRSPNVIDRRGQGGGMSGLGGNLGRMALPIGARFGWKGILIALVVMLLLGGGGLFSGLLGGGDGDEGERQTESAKPADDPSSFVGYVLDDVQNTWDKVFTERGRKYEKADLVLFTDATSTSCGYGQAAVGPFYCPLDNKVYIDLAFYDDLRSRFGAPGDFAQAYVIAHEIGHHVQHQLGTTERVSKGDRGESSDAVRLELQADCFAGVWAHAGGGRDILEPGDIEEAMKAAEAIGDDTLQRKSQGRVQPESWTHGSSEQRVRWFMTGYKSGDPNRCDTFSARSL